MKGTMIIDGQKVQFDGEQHVLEVIRKAGIELPTFCYHSDLSVYGACRMCIVEDKWGGISTSCSTPPKDGMEIFTNTPKLQKHRRMILELLLSSHHRDCTVCEKNNQCKLQELARRFGVRQVRFDTKNGKLPIDSSSTSVVRDPNKCIMCGDCVRMCEEVQGVGVLGFANRGSNIKIVPAFNKELGEVDCVNCGQCITVCPTGALLIKNDTDEIWKALYDKKKRVVAQIAPAVRVALGEAFGLEPGEAVTGKIVAALHRLGFDEVYDTAFAADLTVMEESKEFAERLSSGGKLPLFTSCCPAWVKHAENRYPELLDNISSCRSPQQMFGSVVKQHYRGSGHERSTFIVSIMPCTAKKYEAKRPEFSNSGEKDVDVVITTQELIMMIKETGLQFSELEPDSFDMPFGMASGAGVIFGVTGGVSEAVLRRLYQHKTALHLKSLSFDDVRGMEGIKETQVDLDGKIIKLAIVNGLENANRLIKSIQNGEVEYDFVEVMACPGGCIGGAGQPLASCALSKEERAKGLYKVDRVSQIKTSEENPSIISLYKNMSEDSHEMLHNK
ncbi:2Fe-2S iron-sulfur cluster binding domain-containing protein [Lutispora saccharofermentans]|uniref:[FeFe] hydrogenase, group A n=1 Tax=Lutispora saccharofermentans TaxID=3024236 RepID=A0ABT1NEN9_9FIRM|nr:2Fe-2S iron-sulfur cluster binding domain-containing protein [Lutispora saccharofermentans]MCQ1529084.1 [FeFe] hydrogenase, group A [Lutispora saccharofermentans]